MVWKFRPLHAGPGFSVVTLHVCTTTGHRDSVEISRPPLGPAPLSVDQCDVFKELRATTLLLLTPNFISKGHMALKPFSIGAFWNSPVSHPPLSCKPTLHHHSQVGTTVVARSPPLTKSTKKNLCKEVATVVKPSFKVFVKCSERKL